jgi:hypothetical protein
MLQSSREVSLFCPVHTSYFLKESLQYGKVSHGKLLGKTFSAHFYPLSFPRETKNWDSELTQSWRFLLRVRPSQLDLWTSLRLDQSAAIQDILWVSKHQKNYNLVFQEPIRLLAVLRCTQSTQDTLHGAVRARVL